MRSPTCRPAGVAYPGRPGLSRDRIITTAIDFVDKRGLTALTMRRLGNELGVEAMSLYRYVNGREDLLEGIVDQMVAELQDGPSARRCCRWRWLRRRTRLFSSGSGRVHPDLLRPSPVYRSAAAARHRARRWSRV
jgi:AcrR family transcriptional regulator